MGAVKEVLAEAEFRHPYQIVGEKTFVVLYRGKRGLYDWTTISWWDDPKTAEANHLGRTEIARLPLLEACAQRDAFNAILDASVEDKWNN